MKKIVFGLILIGLLFLYWRHLTSPVNQASTDAQIFVIPQGQPLDQISQRLKQAGLIRSAVAFKLLVRRYNLATKIQAGSFRLSPSLDLTTLAFKLTKGSLDLWVTLLEGWRREEIAEKIHQEIPEFDSAAFVKLSEKQEGYLFPDTYLLAPNASPSAVLNLLNRTFNQKVDLSDNQSGLSSAQVITLASLIEREVRTDADRALVAGILLKRLQSDWPLQVDATIQYALGRPGEWWPKNLSKKDIQINSPFNSYLRQGLPPHPIGNPGLASIQAALHPQASTHWFYLSDSSGKIHYAKTIEEHNANIARYLTK